MIDRYRFVFQNVILNKYQYGRFGLNSLKTLDFSGVLGLQVQHNLLSFWSQALKRVVDIVVFFFGLLALSPFLGLIIVLIKIDSPGGVLFRQPRLGKDGRGFVPLKFRTMHRDADQVLKEKLALDPELRKEWDRYQKLKNDLRITRMGRFLRKFSLDELPQLWNVLVGELSLVGPCPMMVDQRELYGELFDNYAQVVPGITGLWQVSGRNNTTFARRAELDDEYIQRWSLWLDINILLKTVKVVLTQEEAQ